MNHRARLKALVGVSGEAGTTVQTRDSRMIRRSPHPERVWISTHARHNRVYPQFDSGSLCWGSLLLAVFVLGCSGDATDPRNSGSSVSGHGAPDFASTIDTLRGTAGEPIPGGVRLRIEDSYDGAPVAGIPLAWKVLSGGGSVSLDTSITDEAGVIRHRGRSDRMLGWRKSWWCDYQVVEKWSFTPRPLPPTIPQGPTARWWSEWTLSGPRSWPPLR